MMAKANLTPPPREKAPKPGPIPKPMTGYGKRATAVPKLKDKKFSTRPPVNSGRAIARAERANAFRPGRFTSKVEKAIDLG